MSTPIPQFAPRRSDEPVVDLTTHAVAHRAMRVDMRRLAVTTRAICDGQLACTATRAEALHDYLRGMGHHIRAHQRVRRDTAWPLLIAMGVEPSALPTLGSHDPIGSLLDRADELTADLAASPSVHGLNPTLAETLEPLAERLGPDIAAEERAVFPLMREHLSEDSLSWLEGQFEHCLKPQLLPFVVPWVVSHATDEERALMAAHAKMPMRAILKTFESSFVEKQQAAFA